MLSTHAGWAMIMIVVAATALCSGADDELEGMPQRDRLEALTGRLLAFVQAQSARNDRARGPADAESTLRADMAYVYLARARDAMARGDLLNARKSLDRLLASPGRNPSVGEEAIKISRRLEDLGERMLHEAQQAWKSGDPVATVRALRKVSAAMAGRPEGDLARQWLEAAQDHETLRAAVSEADAQVHLDLLLRAAATCLEDDDDRELKIVDLTRTPEADPAIEDLVARLRKLPADKRGPILAALGELADRHKSVPTGRLVGRVLESLRADRGALAKRGPTTRPAQATARNSRQTEESAPRVIRLD